MQRQFPLLLVLLICSTPAWACAGQGATAGQIAITSLLALLGMAVLLLPVYTAMLAVKALFYRRCIAGGAFGKLVRAHRAAAGMTVALGTAYFIFEQFLLERLNKLLPPAPAKHVPNANNALAFEEALHGTNAQGSQGPVNGIIYFCALALVFVLIYRADRKVMAEAGNVSKTAHIGMVVGNMICAFVLTMVFAMAATGWCGEFVQTSPR